MAERFSILDLESDAEIDAKLAHKEWLRWSSLSKEEQRLEALARGIGCSKPNTSDEVKVIEKPTEITKQTIETKSNSLKVIDIYKSGYSDYKINHLISLCKNGLVVIYWKFLYEDLDIKLNKIRQFNNKSKEFIVYDEAEYLKLLDEHEHALRVEELTTNADFRLKLNNYCEENDLCVSTRLRPFNRKIHKYYQANFLAAL